MSTRVTWSQRRNRRHDREIDAWLLQRAAVDLRGRWREATTRSGLGRPGFTPLGGMAVAGLPQVVHVHPSAHLGDPAYLIVTLPPGLLLDDLEIRADELAQGLGCWAIRLRMRGVDHVRVDLVDTDPLSTLVPFLPPAPDGHFVLGVDEFAQVVSFPFEDMTHTVKQGATRKGKSYSTYADLAQFAARARSHADIDVVGIDPTAKVLGPWGPHPHGWRVCGTYDAPARYGALVDALVAEMDRRITAMPPRCDVLPVTADCPRLVVTLEEWPAVARLTGHTRNKPSEVHRQVARLIAEGAKVAVHVMILVQRAETDFIGAFERDQCETRLSFGCADANTLKLLHDGITNDTAALHATSPKGVALAQLPGRDLIRIRTPFIGDYGAYCDAVSPTAPPGTQPGTDTASTDTSSTDRWVA